MAVPKSLPVNPTTLAAILLRFNEQTREIAFAELAQDIGPEAVANLRAMLPALAEQKRREFEEWLEQMRNTPGVNITGPWASRPR